MKQILHVTSSPRGNASYSNRVAAQVVDELVEAHPGARVVIRDLARDPLPHIDENFSTGAYLADTDRTAGQQASIAQSDTLIDELLAADIVVIAVAMINFALPSTLKAWIDHVARRGRTFQYDERGPKGLVTAKKVIVVHAKGGVYSGPRQAYDHATPYLRLVLGFLGMTDVEVIDVEGTALGAQSADQAMENGLNRAREIIAALAAVPPANSLATSSA